MKKLFVIALVGLAAVVSNAQQAFYQATTSLSSTTLYSGVTNLASPIVIDARKQNNVVLTASLRGATVATNSYTFGWSEDGGSTVVTNAADVPPTWYADSPSALSGVRSTNIPTLGHGYLVVLSVNCSAQNTNTLKYSIKTGAP